MGVTHFSAVISTFPVLKKTISKDITLTDQEAADVGILEVTPSANSKSIIFPKAIEGKILFVTNLASATNAVTIKVGATGTGVSVPANKSAILRCTNEDFVAVYIDTTQAGS